MSPLKNIKKKAKIITLCALLFGISGDNIKLNIDKIVNETSTPKQAQDFLNKYMTYAYKDISKIEKNMTYPDIEPEGPNGERKQSINKTKERGWKVICEDISLNFHGLLQDDGFRPLTLVLKGILDNDENFAHEVALYEENNLYGIGGQRWESTTAKFNTINDAIEHLKDHYKIKKINEFFVNDYTGIDLVNGSYNGLIENSPLLKVYNENSVKATMFTNKKVKDTLITKKQEISKVDKKKNSYKENTYDSDSKLIRKIIVGNNKLTLEKVIKPGFTEYIHETYWSYNENYSDNDNKTKTFENIRIHEKNKNYKVMFLLEKNKYAIEIYDYTKDEETVYHINKQINPNSNLSLDDVEGNFTYRSVNKINERIDTPFSLRDYISEDLFDKVSENMSLINNGITERYADIYPKLKSNEFNIINSYINVNKMPQTK